MIRVASKKRMHSYKLLNLSEHANVCHRDSDYIKKISEDISSFAESDNIYMINQCERQSSKPLRYLTIPIICIYMSQFILLPAFYYKTLSQTFLFLSDNKYFPILFAFLYMPLVALPAIFCNVTKKMLDFFLIIAMLTKLLLFTKRYVNFILMTVIMVSYITFICNEIYIFLQFCSIFLLHIAVLLETFVRPEVFSRVIPFCVGYSILL